MAEKGVSVIIPCYNEERAVGPVLDRVRHTMEALERPYEIIAVDDGSADRTVERLEAAAVTLIRHPHNRGYGAALKTGARAARHDTLVITDADGTYPNERIPELLARLENADMVVASRTGERVHVPAARRPAKWALTKLAHYLSGQRIPDLNSGLRAIRRTLWIKYEPVFPDGFSLTTTLTLAALTNGHVVEYLPINYHARVGRSKIRPIRDTMNFIRLILRTVLYFDPLKVFVPLTLALWAAAVGVGGLSWLHGRLMDVTTIVLFMTGLQMLAIGALADLITKRLR